MPRPVSLRLLAVSSVAVFGLAAATVAPSHLAGAEAAYVSDAELFEAADDPQLSATNHELTVRLEHVSVRTSLKEDLVARVIAGRLGLAAAADGFLQLNQESPESLAMMRFYFPGSDDRESAAANVYTFAQQRTAPADWPVVRARLAGEYQALFHHAPVQ